MELSCRPIGYLRTEPRPKFLTPSQPAAGLSGCVELLPEYAGCLADLDGFSRVWLIWWFHKHRTWRPRVLPPRGRSGRKGLFSTRSPHRPNPLGISSVPLLSIEGTRLWIGEHDLLDGTPVLDVKPYVPAFDSFPSESIGWLEAVSDEAAYEVSCAVEMDPDLQVRVLDLLSVDPLPHRTRRIMRLASGEYRLSSGDWRIYYRIEGHRVLIDRVRHRSG